MTEARKSRNSQSTRHALRMLLAILPLPFALSLSLFPELGELQIIPILLVFAFGMAVGTMAHVYWLRTLLKERAFYLRFYSESALKPHKMDKELGTRHTRILLPFYALSIMLFLIVLFVFGIFSLDFTYALPFVLGAMEGVPLSYYLMEKGIFS